MMIRTVSKRLALIPLIALAACSGNPSNRNPSPDPGKKNAPKGDNQQATLELQVENLVGDKKLKAYLVNTSAQEVDLKPYKMDVKVATVKDVRDQELAGGGITVPGTLTGVSMENGGVVADLIGFTKGQQKLGAEQKVELEGLALDLPLEAVEAQVVLVVNNSEGTEKIEQKLTWMSRITIAIKEYFVDPEYRKGAKKIKQDLTWMSSITTAIEEYFMGPADRGGEEVNIYLSTTIKNRAAAPLVLKELTSYEYVFTSAGTTDTDIKTFYQSGQDFVERFYSSDQDKALPENEESTHCLEFPIKAEPLIAAQEVYVRLIIKDEKGELLNAGVHRLAITKP